VRKSTKVIVSIFCIVAGWILIGIGYTIPHGPLVNTGCGMLGLISFIGGIIWFLRLLF